MTSFSIGGLESGIDTNSLIQQLLVAAAAPQTAEESQLATQQTVNTTYQTINTKLAAVATAAAALKDPDTWNATTATASDSSVVATGSPTAQAGSYSTFTVNSVASAQVSTLVVSGATVADPTQGIDVLGADGTSHHVDLTDGTATTVAAAVNGAGLGVRAALVSTDSGQVLQFTSTSTGSKAAFTINGLSSPPQTLIAAQNAQITVGDPASGGYKVSSQTNTFTNAIPGVTFTVSKPIANVSISVATDQTSISNSVQALVNAVNASLTEIGTDTAQGAALAGDPTTEAIQQSLLAVVSAGSSNGGSYSTYGISLTSTGALTFDASAFQAAYTADPTGARSALGTTLAPAFNNLATQATDSTTGSITALINSGKDEVSTLNTEISDWTLRLSSMQTSLQSKFAGMETALSTLKNESNFLNSFFGGGSSTTSSGSGANTSS